MTTDDADIDAMFQELVAGVEITEPTDVLDVSKLDDFKLIRVLEQVKAKLYGRKELLVQTTDEGRALFSTYEAALGEAKKRRLK